MGWLWGSSNNSNKDDPVKNLDPELKEYLKQETPSKYVPSTGAPQEPAKPAVEASDKPTEDAESSKPSVPSASLFQDGRYAHLWKNYRPLEEIENNNTMGGAERVVAKFHERKGSLHKAAMENCSLEQEDLLFCFKNGGHENKIWNRITLCSDATKKYNRCYVTQAVSFSTSLSVDAIGEFFATLYTY